MVKRIFYYILRAYVKAGLIFYFSKFRVQGLENIPSDGPVIFAANHQNAFLDALLIGTTTLRYTHNVSRADAFRKPLAAWALSLVNMMPIYRIRDGWQSLGQNERVLNRCAEILAAKQSMLIFPEGNHGARRRLRNLSKGFTRIVFLAMEKNPAINVQIVPVGLNYSNHPAFLSRVRVIYGKPIAAKEFFAGKLAVQSQRLRDELASRIKSLITHIEDEANYQTIIEKLNLTNPNYLDPVDVNQRIEKIIRGEPVEPSPQKKRSLSLLLLPLKPFAWIINAIPLLIWAAFRKKIKDHVFIASIKYCIGITVFPLFYMIVSTVAWFFFGAIYAAGLSLFSLISMRILRNP